MKKIIIASIAALAVSSTLMAAVSSAGCKGCHGQNFEKKALGKSQVVSNMTHDQIQAALLGYKDGSYGGAMKGLMKGQVAKYSEADLKAFAQTIGK